MTAINGAIKHNYKRDTKDKPKLSLTMPLVKVVKLVTVRCDPFSHALLDFILKRVLCKRENECENPLSVPSVINCIVSLFP